jgi:hypothetical protein
MVNNGEREDVVQKYYNEAQLLFALANPTTAYLRWARGTGKTEGPICYRMDSVVTKMPTSNNAIAVPSYQKFLKDLLPAIRKGLSLYGYREGKDWVIGEQPPRGWATPYYKPDTYNAVMSFRNGTIYSLFSQDSKTKNQGNSLTSLIGDEAKLLDFERIKEDIINAMRGRADVFGHLPEFQSILFTSDGYRREKNFNWFFDAEKKANKEEMDALITLALKKDLSPRGKQALDYARKNVFFYHKASAVVNRHALGYNYFKNAFENSTPQQFLVSNLNYEMNRIEGSFYMYLNEEKQGRFAGNVSYYEGLGFNDDIFIHATCEGDDDVNYEIPLGLGFDFGGANCCAVVSQMNNAQNTFSMLKDFVESGHKEIDRYYGPFKRLNRDMVLFYDLSGNNDRQGSLLPIAQEIKKLLTDLGWRVTVGNTRVSYIPHNTKFNIWKKVLYEGSDRDKAYPKFRYNRVNAERTALSMGNAPTKDDNGMIKKDKSSEKNKNISYAQATHLSDAVDNNLCFPLLDIYESRKRAWIKTK